MFEFAGLRILTSKPPRSGASIQRGTAEVARNHTGFRFTPRGDKLVLINEGGYLRAASGDAHEAWFRAGAIYNTTPYRNETTGLLASGNYCAYALMDYQLLKSNREHPKQGLYAGDRS